MRALIVALGAVGLLCGCGQTGPLYLPDRETAIEVRPPAPTEPLTEDAGPTNIVAKSL